jgi:hypothetical protein
MISVSLRMRGIPPVHFLRYLACPYATTCGQEDRQGDVFTFEGESWERKRLACPNTPPSQSLTPVGLGADRWGAERCPRIRTVTGKEIGLMGVGKDGCVTRL